MTRSPTAVSELRARVARSGWALALAVAGVGTLWSAPVAGAAVAPLVWTEPASASPPALRDPAMAYDPDTRRVVLFGGASADGTPSSATWLWDGSGWTQAALGAAGAGGPPARSGASMAFDATDHQFILFGGIDATGNALADTWAWNGESWVAQPFTTAPPARLDASMAPDASGRLVLFGGTATSAPPPSGATTTTAPAPGPTVLGDTWAWQGNGWVKVAQAATSPPARTGAAMDFDPVHDQTVLFGGSSTPAGTAPDGLADTWTYNGATWTQAAPTTSPSARSGSTLAGDPAAGGIVLAGGLSGTAALADTWGWNGADWTQLTPSGTAPPSRTEAGGAYDGATSSVVVFGGATSTGAAVAATAVLATEPPSPTPTTVPTPTTQPVVPRATPTTAPPAHPSPTSPTQTVAPHPTTTAPASPTPASLPGPASTPPAAPAGPEAVRPGDRVVLLGAGFEPGAVVNITFHSTTTQVASVVAGPDGQASATVLVPSWAKPGDHHFEMAGPSPAGTTTTLLTAVTVLATPSRAHSINLDTPVLVAVALLLPAGTLAALALWGRRRGSTTPTPTP